MKLLQADLSTSKHVLWDWNIPSTMLNLKGKIYKLTLIYWFNGISLYLRKLNCCRREKSLFKYFSVMCILGNRNCPNDFSLKIQNLGKLKLLAFLSDFIFFLFSFIFISWRLITLQYCSGFCHTLTWISHGFTCVPHPDPPSHLPPHPIPLGLPSAPALSTCLMHPTWAGDLFQTW